MPSTNPVLCSAQASNANRRVWRIHSPPAASSPAQSAAMAKLNGTAKEL